MRSMNRWNDTWGRIRWYDEYSLVSGFSYEKDSDSQVIQRIKNYYNAGVNFNMADKSEEGMTPLHYAARFRSVKIAEILIDGGADMCVGDDKGRTPLHYAAEVGDLAMAQYLVEHAPKDYEKVKDRDGKVASQYAALNGHEKVVQFFEDLAHPEEAKARKEKEAKKKRRLNTLIIGLCIVGALSLGGYAATKILKKTNEKSKVELKTENAQANVKQKAVEYKKPEPKRIQISEPAINSGNSIGRMRTIDGTHLGNNLSSDTRYLHTYNRSRGR